MKPISIEYNRGKEGDENYMAGSASMNFPENVNEMIELWGEDLVFNKARAQIVIDARRLCYEADSPEQAQEMVDAFVPGVSRARGAGGISQKALIEKLKELPEDKRAEVLAAIGM